MKYHFIGDQGISMRGLKEYLINQGNEVTGSDLKTGGHKKENVAPDVDIVVRTSAVTPGSEGWVEVLEAQRLGIKVIKRSELIGQLTQGKELVAVSGMHGKTTVTTLAGLLFIQAGLDPTVLVGECVKEFDDDVLRVGNSSYFVMEACEYDRSFLDFLPKTLILTNIEEEHLDTYPKGLPEIMETFVAYLDKIPSDGAIIACKEDANVRAAVSQTKSAAKVIWYGEGSDYIKIGYNIALPGPHNRLNALAILALADYYGIEPTVARQVLESFTGAKRRFEIKGEYNGATLIDDYGHHPTEIKAAINSLAERFPDKKKIVVFWPHQYKRVKPFLHQFADSFEAADEVILKPIYLVPGRDEKLDVSSADIMDLIKKHDTEKPVYLMEGDEEIVDHLKSVLDENSVLLTIGIPPVYRVSDLILGK